MFSRWPSKYCVIATMVLCHLHNDFLCCCIGVMCLQNDFWMSTKTLHDLKDYVEPSVFLCALTMSLCPPKTLCDLLQWWLTAFTMTLIFTVTSPLHSDPLWPFYWLSDLHTKVYLSLYFSTNNCCPQTDYEIFSFSLWPSKCLCAVKMTLWVHFYDSLWT